MSQNLILFVLLPHQITKKKKHFGSHVELLPRRRKFGFSIPEAETKKILLLRRYAAKLKSEDLNYISNRGEIQF